MEDSGNSADAQRLYSVTTRVYKKFFLMILQRDLAHCTPCARFPEHVFHDLSDTAASAQNSFPIFLCQVTVCSPEQMDTTSLRENSYKLW